MRSKFMLQLTAFALMAAAAFPANAQRVRCPEGRTITGECVEPDIAVGARKDAMVYALPKLSYTSPPYLPSQDSSYFALRDHHAIASFYYQPYISPGTSGFFTVRP
jgi:hypothetical protein